MELRKVVKRVAKGCEKLKFLEKNCDGLRNGDYKKNIYSIFYI
jgi:hypothetical protein